MNTCIINGCNSKRKARRLCGVTTRSETTEREEAAEVSASCHDMSERIYAENHLGKLLKVIKVVER